MSKTGASAKRGYGPPPEVIRYFSEKRLRPGFSWLDVWGEEHAHAFTVAGVTQLDALGAIKKSLLDAEARGQGFETWKAALEPELRQLGWWGKKIVADPTGADPEKVVDLSRPHRLRTIFDTNMRTARAAGQWDRIQRSKRVLPYLLYVESTSKEKRQEHTLFYGVILPVDHPWWRTHFPPNGWGCKCAVRAITERDAKRRTGLGGYRTTPPSTTLRTFVNRRTGEITKVPKGIHPGFAHNPGVAKGRERVLANELTRAASEAVEAGLRQSARRVVRESVEGPDFGWFHNETMQRVEVRAAVARSSSGRALSKGVNQRAQSEAAPWTNVARPVAIAPPRMPFWAETRPVVTVTDWAVGHSYGRHPLESAQWKLVQQVLDVGEIQLSENEPGRVRLIAEIEGQNWLLALARQDAGWSVVTFFPANSRYVTSQAAKPGRIVWLKQGENIEEEK